MVVELGGVLHDRRQRRSSGAAEIELRRRNVARKAAEIPAQEEEAGREGGKARRDRRAERLPRRVLVARPVARHGAGAGEAGTTERDRREAVVGLPVKHGVAVVRLAAMRSVGIDKVGAPRVLAAIRLEAVDAKLLDQV